MGIRESYTAAGAFPNKLLHNKIIYNDGKILPIIDINAIIAAIYAPVTPNANFNSFAHRYPIIPP